MRVRFIKLWDYKRFDFQPRFYDKAAEELDSRVSVTASDAKREAIDAQHKERISEAFARRERQAKQPIYIRLIIVAILTSLLIGFYIWVAQL